MLSVGVPLDIHIFFAFSEETLSARASPLDAYINSSREFDQRIWFSIFIRARPTNKVQIASNGIIRYLYRSEIESKIRVL